MSHERTGIDRILAPRFLPSHLFGGRARTSTLFLVILWLVLYCLNVYLNPEEPEPSVMTTPPAVTSESPVETTQEQTSNPVTTETTTEPTTTTESTPSATATTTPRSGESGSTSATTGVPGFPGFGIPGLNQDTPASESEPTTTDAAVPAP